MNPPPLLFRHADLFDGRRFRSDCDLRVAGGRVVEIGRGLRAAAGEESIDLGRRWLLPGLVDCHVHFREPGLVRKEGYAFGSAGALHGGVTTVLEIQNNPPLMESGRLLAAKIEALRGVSRVDYGPYGSLTPASAPRLAELAPRCPAVKCFLGCSTGAGGVRSEEDLRRLFAAAAEVGVKVVAHCEDNGILDRAAAELAGIAEPRHDRMRPAEAEIRSVEDAIRVADETGAELHVFHLSTGEGAARVAAANAAGQAVTGTTAPHYLLVDAEAAAAAEQHRFKVNPSIKSAADGAALRELVAAGRLQGIGTDHAPHPLAEKERPYRQAPSGFPSIDLLLPLVVAVHDRFGTPLEPLLAAVTRLPAEEFGLERKGRLEPGADADLVAADPERARTVDERRLLSRSGWSPYHGWRLRAFAERVWLRGHEVFAAGRPVGPPRGRPLF
ncbi:MAG: hypothetical protein D6702_11940 [Planctomycetota bacterium]|nr:MAG: hypothetical protein D6702_11940 [Planctomycetota bacterium]